MKQTEALAALNKLQDELAEAGMALGSSVSDFIASIKAQAKQEADALIDEVKASLQVKEREFADLEKALREAGVEKPESGYNAETVKAAIAKKGSEDAYNKAAELLSAQGHQGVDDDANNVPGVNKPNTEGLTGLARTEAAFKAKNQKW